MRFLFDEWHGLWILVTKLVVTSGVNPGTEYRPHIGIVNNSRLAAIGWPIPSLDLDDYVKATTIIIGNAFPRSYPTAFMPL